MVLFGGAPPPITLSTDWNETPADLSFLGGSSVDTPGWTTRAFGRAIDPYFLSKDLIV
jgi:hypothetical protein